MSARSMVCPGVSQGPAFRRTDGRAPVVLNGGGLPPPPLVRLSALQVRAVFHASLVVAPCRVSRQGAPGGSRAERYEIDPRGIDSLLDMHTVALVEIGSLHGGPHLGARGPLQASDRSVEQSVW